MLGLTYELYLHHFLNAHLIQLQLNTKTMWVNIQKLDFYPAIVLIFTWYALIPYYERNIKLCWWINDNLQFTGCLTVLKKTSLNFPTFVFDYRNWFVTQYFTYLNIWQALSRVFSSLSTHDKWLCYKPIPITYRTSPLQNSLKFICIWLYRKFWTNTIELIRVL